MWTSLAADQSVKYVKMSTVRTQQIAGLMNKQENKRKWNDTLTAAWADDVEV